MVEANIVMRMFQRGRGFFDDEHRSVTSTVAAYSKGQLCFPFIFVKWDPISILSRILSKELGFLPSELRTDAPTGQSYPVPSAQGNNRCWGQKGSGSPDLLQAAAHA